MKLLALIGADEMVAVFLRTEVNSSRYSQQILDALAGAGRDRRIVDEPDLNSAADNTYRRQLLGAYRGYERNESLFEGFPRDVSWWRALVTVEELAQVRYIAYDYWIELSDGSRLAPDAAARIRQSIEIFRVSNAGFWHLAEAIERGAQLPELILGGTEESAPLVVLEGHARLTAYFLAPAAIPRPLPVIVGFAPDLPAWPLY